MDPEMKKCFDDLNSKIDSCHSAQMKEHEKTQKKVDDMDDGDMGAQRSAAAVVELDPEIVALTGKSGAEAVGMVAAWKSAAGKLPQVEAELLTLQKTVASAERKTLIDGMLANGKLKPAMKSWADAADLASLRTFEAAATAEPTPFIEPSTSTPAGGPNVTADMIPTDAAQKHNFLMAQFRALPADEQKIIGKTNHTDKDKAEYMERRIARTKNGRVDSRPKSVSRDD